MSLEPRLSITLRTFAAEDPGTWEHVVDRARAADAAGIDQLVVSDHVVYGENLEAYGRPELGGSEGRQATHRTRRTLARTAHHAHLRGRR